MVKIFDFDLSTVYPHINNKLDNDNLCRDFGLCNTFNSKFDAFIILYFLLEVFRSMKKDAVREFLKDFVLKQFDKNSQLLETEWGFPGRLCKCKQPRPQCGECDGSFEPIDSEMKSIKNIATSDHFNEYKHNLPEYDPRYLPSKYEYVYYATKDRPNQSNIFPISFSK